LIEYMAIDNPL